MKRNGSRESLDARRPVQSHTAGLRALAFSPCGHKLAAGGQDCAVVLWCAEMGTAEQVFRGHAFRGHAEMVSSVSFSVNGERLVIGNCGLLIHK